MNKILKLQKNNIYTMNLHLRRIWIQKHNVCVIYAE